MQAKNDRPWMTALEMQFAAANVAQRALFSGAKVVQDDGKYRAMLSTTTVYLPMATAYTWSADVFTAIFMAAKTIPSNSTLTRSLLPPSLHSWWWFEAQTPYVGYGIEDDDLHAIGGLLLATRDEDDCLDITTFGIDKERARLSPFPATRWVWPFGASIDSVHEKHPAHHLGERTDQSRLHVEHFGRIILAALTWLQQRIIVTSLGQIERHRKKQIAREHDVAPPSDVKVIQLRRTESQPSLQKSGIEAVDWSCRWIVGGHWRNQPYKDERKLIYIMPYVKGPEDKPLKVPSQTVYSVSR